LFQLCGAILEEASGIELTEKDIEIVVYITAKVNTRLQSIRKKYSTPMKYAHYLIKGTKHKDTIAAAVLLNDVRNIDPDTWYKPEDFRKIITKKMQSDIVNDNTDLITAIGDDHQHTYVSYKDMNRALKELERDIGLINKRGKEQIKKVRGKQKIKFSGSPSVYRLPSDVSDLEKAMSNPKVIELVFRSLKRLGLLDYLAFLLEAFFHTMRASLKEKAASSALINLIKSTNEAGLKLDASSWESYCKILLTQNDTQLKIIAKNLAQSMIENPQHYRNILLCALSIS
jgi:hypothetical protein